MSARRTARSAKAKIPSPVDGGPPAELYDADAPLWHDFDLYRAWMKRRGWERSMPPEDRLYLISLPAYGSDHRHLAGMTMSQSHPANRRSHAADQWAAESGIGRWNWHRLREMGLIE